MCGVVPKGSKVGIDRPKGRDSEKEEALESGYVAIRQLKGIQAETRQ